MALEKQPETELEYWQAICATEREILRISDGFRRGLIPIDKRSKEKQALEIAKIRLDSLLIDIEHKFGVLCRKKHPVIFARGIPQDKKDYLNWWNEMDTRAKSELEADF